MAKLSLSDEQQERLEHFMNHRQLKDHAVSLLKDTKEANELKSTELKTAKNLTYRSIRENLLTAVDICSRL